jgi:uncharacterized protein YjdB
VLAALLVAGCGGTEPKAPVLTTITVSITSSTVVTGGTAQATAIGQDQDGAIMTIASVGWSSNNSAVATVSNDGLVTGVGAGSAQIIATSGVVQGGVALNVSPIPVATVEVTGPASEVVGGRATYSVVTTAADGSVLIGRTVSWSVSDPTKA